MSALVLREGVLVAIPNLREPWNSTTLEQESPPWDQAAWSGDSRAVTIFRAKTTGLQTIRAIDGTAASNPPVDLSSLPGTLTALATDQEGQHIFAGISGDDGGLYWLAPGQPPSRIASGKNFTSVAFDPVNHALFAVDRDARTLWEVSHADSSPAATVFSDAAGGVGDAVGVSVPPGRQRLILANREDRSLQVFELASRSVAETVMLEAAPVMLCPLGEGIFLLNPRTTLESPLYILEARSAVAVYFVPAGSVE
jgi:hypothetical protein